VGSLKVVETRWSVRLVCINDGGVGVKSDGTKSQSSIDADE
jgi:hypothetical protein